MVESLSRVKNYRISYTDDTYIIRVPLILRVLDAENFATTRLKAAKDELGEIIFEEVNFPLLISEGV